MTALVPGPSPHPSFESDAPSGPDTDSVLLPVGPLDTVESIEDVRTRHVEALGLLGVSADRRFDRLTRLAQVALDVPYATVTIVADGTAWFPSAAGIEIDSMPRADTFCNVTVTRACRVVVPDACADPVFAGLPAVTAEPHIRSYVGVPLVDGDGVTVGSFCIYDTRPRQFSTAELATVDELATWAQHDLVASADTVRARSVQQALLPTHAVDLPGLRVAGLCVPVGAVGGDFFDWAVVHGTLVFSLVDVMGKGTAAALVAATVRALLRSTAVRIAAEVGRREVVQPVGALRGGIGSVVGEVDKLVSADLERTGSLVTGFIGQLDPAEGTLHYADAGHGLTALIRADGRSEWLGSRDLPIGVDADTTWEDRAVSIDRGDIVLCCSDGLFDLLGGTSAALRQIEALARACPDPAEIVAQVDRLTRTRAPVDDVTVVAIRRNEG